MVRIYKTIDGAIHQIQEPEEGCWIALTNPTATEIFEFSEKFDIEVDDLRSPLDEEERSRIEVEDNYTLILVDVPMIEERNSRFGSSFSVRPQIAHLCLVMPPVAGFTLLCAIAFLNSLRRCTSLGFTDACFCY